MAGSTHIFMFPEQRPVIAKPPVSDASSPKSPSAGSSTGVSALSSGVSGTCRTGSDDSSWITCSETNVPNDCTPAAAVAAAAPAHSLTQASSGKDSKHESTPVKYRITSMLSAVDRRRKQTLPQAKSGDFQVTREPSAETLTQTETQTPLRAAKTSLKSPRMQPRGPAEREDYSELRDFLNSTRVKPEEMANMDGPKSGFDWDDSDEDASPKLKHSRLRALQHVTKQWKTAARGDANKGMGVKNVFGTGTSVDEWVKRANDYAEAQSGGVEVVVRPTKDDDMGTNLSSDSPTPVSNTTTRSRMVEHFDGAVWSNDKGITTDIASSDGHIRNASAKDEDEYEMLAEASCSELVPADASPATIDESVKSDQVENVEANEATFRQIEWSRHGRGISAIDISDCKPDSTRVLGTSDLHSSVGSETASQKSLSHKPSISSMLRKLRSQVFETASLPKSAAPNRPPSRISQSSQTRNSSTTSQRRHSAEEARGAKVEDPFTGSPTRSLTVRASRQSDRSSRDSKTPTREEEQVSRSPGSETAQSEQQLQLSSPKSSSPSSFYAAWGGYPKGPEHPNWNDTIRRVKKIVEAREKREAEEARQQRKELRKDEKKLKRLKAGKDIVLRGSQLGLALRKPLHEMAEEEFEAFGAFFTNPRAPDSPSKRGGVFSGLFTKIVGSAREKEDHAEQTKQMLDRHRSLQLLNRSVDLQDVSSPPEDPFDFEEALAELIQNEKNEQGSTSSRTDVGYCSSGSSARKRAGTLPNILEEDVENETDTADTVTNASAATARDASTATITDNTTPIKPKIFEEDMKKVNRTGTPPAVGCSAEKSSPPSNIKPSEKDESDDNDDGSSWCTIDEIEEAAASTFAAFQTRATDPGKEEDEWVDDDDASKYSDEINADAIPLPLNIRVLKVKRSSTHIQPVDSNSFIPDRKASFHARIQEVSRLQVAHMRGASHPALRGIDGGGGQDGAECLREGRLGTHAPVSPP